MQRIFFWLMSTMLICLLITGCRSTPSAADPTPVRAMTPVPTFTTTPESTPTLTQISPPLSPTPVPTPQPVITLTPLNETVRLPATLYFLSMEGQLWSLGGQTNQYRQLTNEALPIIDFDIALTHGRLVYVTNNQLIEFDPATNQRIVKLASLPEAELWALNETGYRYCAQCSTDQILSPRYSPDGAQIAYAQGGINVIASGADTSAPPQQVQVNIRFQIDTQNVNATRFYDDSH